MRNAVLMLPLWAVLLGQPLPVDAKGGGMQARPNKDFRELIVKGERPEIAACLVAAIEYARRNPAYSAIRWDDDASDRALMRETQSQGRLTRYIQLTADLKSQGSVLFAGTWQRSDIFCEQPEDGMVHVSVKSRLR